jgi:bifunctional enzyme CysN/CysC
MDLPMAGKGESIALTLAEQIYVERGELISPPDQAPEISSNFEATVVWLSPEPLRIGSPYLLKMGTSETSCTLALSDRSHSADEKIVNGAVVDVIVKTTQPVTFDRQSGGGGLNRFVLCSTFETIAAGVVNLEQKSQVSKPTIKYDVQVEHGYLGRAERERIQGHKGAVLWCTGLSGAGKSTVAKSIERKLFEKNCRVVTLDADTVRTGLCIDLGFSPEERKENIRRIAEVAKLCLDMGSIVVVACLSPFRQDRELAREIIGTNDFLEIFISCPIEICRSRDPKGLYHKVDQGRLKSFSGLDSPYQPPIRADLVLDSSALQLEEEVAAIMKLLREKAVFE